MSTKEQVLDNTIKRCRERNIIIPTYEQMRDPEKIPEGIKEELKNSEKRLKIIFDYAPNAYFLYDLKGTFIDGNKAAEELVGYKKEELIGKNMLKAKLLPLEEIPKASKYIVETVLGKVSGPNELTLIRKDGSRVLTEITAIPVKIKGRTVVLGITRDITKRKRIEEALKKKNEELERFNKIVMGRELKMVELKKKIKELEEKLNKRE